MKTPPPPPPSRWRRVWLWPHLMCLDAPAVALGWQALFAEALRVKLFWPLHLGLGLAVWVIYAADRVIDAFKADEIEQTARHGFARQSGGWLIALILAAAAGAAYLGLWYVPEDLAGNASLLGAGSVLYLLPALARRGQGLFRLGVVGAAVLIGFSGIAQQWPPMRGESFFPSISLHPMQFAYLGAAAGLAIASLVLPPPRGTFRFLPKEIFCGVIFAAGVTLAPRWWGQDLIPRVRTGGTLPLYGTLHAQLPRHQRLGDRTLGSGGPELADLPARRGRAVRCPGCWASWRSFPPHCSPKRFWAMDRPDGFFLGRDGLGLYICTAGAVSASSPCTCAAAASRPMRCGSSQTSH
ncbi:MAG: hypothetical protein R3F11_22700 [Verrucomicrobiales bacterium]